METSSIGSKQDHLTVDVAIPSSPHKSIPETLNHDLTPWDIKAVMTWEVTTGIFWRFNDHNSWDPMISNGNKV